MSVKYYALHYFHSSDTVMALCDFVLQSADGCLQKHCIFFHVYLDTPTYFPLKLLVLEAYQSVFLSQCSITVLYYY